MEEVISMEVVIITMEEEAMEVVMEEVTEEVMEEDTEIIMEQVDTGEDLHT